ncbi:Hypothetical protein LUCI_3968 [Lucifera butyrica]|uniref:Uncharacterized protein n=1 Tax=Lucifera butyrica TaxID=1351585 RepID=A0A498RCU2_9FIRM|nr:hypothetical protein [Lucifera butyrica]VBB08690.1 Hypothetical protein LUCI_3968 [Lucifera butyrica]
MDSKYPHWYHGEDKMEPCCDYMGPEMMCEEEHMPQKMYYTETFQDRIMTLLGDEVLFSVDARIGRRESFCGTLCYVGCNFIIVNVCLCGKSLSMHIPIKCLRFIAPYKSHRR